MNMATKKIRFEYKIINELHVVSTDDRLYSFKLYDNVKRLKRYLEKRGILNEECSF